MPLHAQAGRMDQVIEEAQQQDSSRAYGKVETPSPPERRRREGGQRDEAGKG